MGQVMAHEACAHHENPETAHLIYEPSLVTTLKTLTDAVMITQNAVSSLFTRPGPPFNNHTNVIRACEILP